MLSQSVLDSINFFPDQIQTAFEYFVGAEHVQPLRGVFDDIKNIVVCGMGGSRFPAIIAKELFKEELTVPFEINDNYTLPGFVNEETLVILSSYSGTTEEVLACGLAAIERKAKMIGVSSVPFPYTSYPFYTPFVFSPQFNPSNQPRMGFGYTLGAILGILLHVGAEHVQPLQKSIESAITNLRSLDQHSAAKSLAQKLFNKYPTYVVAEFLIGCGNAIANQTNETAKTNSVFRVIPEMNHHLLEGLKHPTFDASSISLNPLNPLNSLNSLSSFIFFFSKLYSPQIQKRFLITKDVVEQNKIETIWHELKSTDKISQVFEMLQFGSLMTMYLADLYQENPEVVPYVDYFKKKLKE